MKLQQLRYIVAMVRHDLNVSQTADALFTSQPGVSKQIRQLEDEIGVEIFQRSGKQITQVTPAGERIIEIADSVLQQIEDIRTVGREHANPNVGELRIATTHTQARYVLPPIIEKFREQYPHVVLHMHQGTPGQIAEMAASGLVDFAIATEGMSLFADLVMLPCYHWHRAVLVPEGHPLQKIDALDGLTLEALSTYPLITYVFGFTGQSKLDDAFRRSGLKPNVVLTASDADVIKTYVRLGLGVGIVAELSVAESAGEGLVALDADRLFSHSTTHIAFRKAAKLRGFMYDFIELFAPHLNAEMVDEATALGSATARDKYFSNVKLRTL